MSEQQPSRTRAELFAEWSQLIEGIAADYRHMPPGIEANVSVLWRRLGVLEQVVACMLAPDFDMAEPPQRTGEGGGT